MEYDLIISQNKKIGLFTDIHYGKNKDDLKKLEQMDKCVDWIIDTFKTNGVDYVFFLGDLFESRFCINVHTLNRATEAIKKLCDNFEKVFMILGNHDIYYKNINNINSVKIFKDLADNITIIEDKPLFLNLYGHSLALIPWGIDLNQIFSNIDQPFDYVFGHFEINGMELVGSVQTGADYDMSTLYKLSPYTFTGHYHISKIYGNKNHKINSLGCPLQLDWGDFNKSKYIAILDLAQDQKNKIQMYENTINSRFEKIYLSKLKSGIYTDLNQFVKNNYIKFVVDDTCDFNEVLQYSNNIKQLNPLSVEVEYLHSLTDDVDFDSVDISVEESKDMLQYIIEYTTNVYEEIVKNDPNTEIDKDCLIRMAISYYNKCREGNDNQLKNSDE